MKYYPILLLLLAILHGIDAQTDTVILAENREQLVQMVRDLEDDPRYAVSVTVFTGEVNPAGDPDGRWIYYEDLDKKLKIYEGEYVDGLKEGVWLRYTNNYWGSKLSAQENWRNDKLLEYASFYDTHKPSIHFKSKYGVDEEAALAMYVLEQIGHGLMYYLPQSPDEIRVQILDIIVSILLDAGLPQAEIAFWNHEEQLSREYLIENNELVQQIHYQYSFSKIEQKQVFINKLLHSTEVYDLQYYEKRYVRTYYPNGEVMEEGDLLIEEDRKTGLWKGYYENGKKKYSGVYRQGEKHGVWKHWTENGDVVEKIQYKNGMVVD
ncbi:toxin-antitoxin system YwqK family antitoxin [Lewinella sp. LCG006]|uniref:toxin-antitoxin system YwqK family antitoxin n=1 Tax=Lewinella sp. LCG006 TaxID=3231911 RepID=UPI0034609D31